MNSDSNRLRRHSLIILSMIFALLYGTLTMAQESYEEELTPEETAELEEMRAFWDSLDRQKGDVTLLDGVVTLAVPDDFYFLGSHDAERVLVDEWGNPPGQDVLGMLFPEKYTPFDGDSWAVTIEYSDEGHISDEDAASIDYGDLLDSMQADTRDANPARIEAGYESVTLKGWAEPPHYDQVGKKLYWAKELQFGEADYTTLNYEIRSLGRVGVLSMTFIAATQQLNEINASRDTVLAMATFNPGHTYSDFDPSIDKVAAYGIGALITGKVAAKAGLLTGLIILLKKFGVYILIGLIALAGKFRNVFSRKKED